MAVQPEYYGQAFVFSVPWLATIATTTATISKAGASEVALTNALTTNNAGLDVEVSLTAAEMSYPYLYIRLSATGQTDSYTCIIPVPATIDSATGLSGIGLTTTNVGYLDSDLGAIATAITTNGTALAGLNNLSSAQVVTAAQTALTNQGLTTTQVTALSAFLAAYATSLATQTQATSILSAIAALPAPSNSTISSIWGEVQTILTYVLACETSSDMATKYAALQTAISAVTSNVEAAVQPLALQANLLTTAAGVTALQSIIGNSATVQLVSLVLDGNDIQIVAGDCLDPTGVNGRVLAIPVTIAGNPTNWAGATFSIVLPGLTAPLAAPVITNGIATFTLALTSAQTATLYPGESTYKILGLYPGAETTSLVFGAGVTVLG